MGFSKAILLAALLAFPAGARASPPITLKYSEGGNWVVRVLAVDDEGYPDTVERRVYATEKQADERVRVLHETRGAIEKASVPTEDPKRELRNPLVGEIWTATESWSTEWEAKFADWIRANFDKRFYKRYRVKTDCADATVALRWIYSRIFGLPAGNRLDSGDVLLTNRSVRAAWKDLPTAENWYDDRRFRAALDYVLENTYTHTVHADAYPIEIGPTYLTEGAFHLELRTEDGHTRVFTNVSLADGAWPLEDMWSNVPRKVRALVVEPFTVFVQPPMRFGGIVRHRWVRLTDDSAYLVPAEQMPGYSLEQYLPDFFKHDTIDFSAEVAARLHDALDPLIGLRAILSNLERSVGERKTLVEDGFRVCASADCSPGTKNYEDWSSPSRDARLGQYFDQVDSTVAALHGDVLDRARKLLARAKRKNLLKIDGIKYRYDAIAAAWRAKRYSSDPRDPPTKRWGL